MYADPKQSSHISELILPPFSSYHIECLIIRGVVNGSVRRFNGDIGQGIMLFFVVCDCAHVFMHPSKSAQDVTFLRAWVVTISKKKLLQTDLVFEVIDYSKMNVCSKIAVQRKLAVWFVWIVPEPSPCHGGKMIIQS